jgi:hypothetical protein
MSSIVEGPFDWLSVPETRGVAAPMLSKGSEERAPSSRRWQAIFCKDQLEGVLRSLDVAPYRD